MPMGQVTGAVRILSTLSTSSSSSMGGRPSRSSLLMKVMMGVSRMPADLHQLDGPLLDTLGAVDDHERAVHRGERAIRVLGEVLVARRVQQVDDLSRNGNCITEEVMEIPRCFSSAIQSEVA